MIPLGSALLLGLAGCGVSIDPGQARLCRLAAVALADPAAIRVRTQASLPADASGRGGVRVDVLPAADLDPDMPLWVECRFAHGALNALRTDGGDVAEANLFMLKRFWLAAPESAAADPLDEDEALPRLPFGLAYPLQQGLAALPKAAIYALLAGSYSLVYGLTGRINLAFGDIAGLGGVAALIGVAALANAALGGTMPGGAVAAMLLVAAALGLWSAALHGVAVHRLVVWPLRRATGQQGLVATLGLALALGEYIRLATGNQPKWIAPILENPVALARAPGFTVTVTPIALILAGAALGASLGVLALLRFTGFGRAWRASADDPLAAALFGIDPHDLGARTFALACGLAGLAGASVTVLYGSVGAAFTTTLGLKALVGAVLGGIGSVPGAFSAGSPSRGSKPDGRPMGRSNTGTSWSRPRWWRPWCSGPVASWATGTCCRAGCDAPKRERFQGSAPNHAKGLCPLESFSPAIHRDAAAVAGRLLRGERRGPKFWRTGVRR